MLSLPQWFTSKSRPTIHDARASALLAQESTMTSSADLLDKMHASQNTSFFVQETHRLNHLPLTDDPELLQFASIVAPAAENNTDAEIGPFVVPDSGVYTLRGTITYEVPFNLPATTFAYVLTPVISRQDTPSKFTEVVKRPPASTGICANGQLVFQQFEQATLTQGDRVSWELVVSDTQGTVLSNIPIQRTYARFTYLLHNTVKPQP